MKLSRIVIAETGMPPHGLDQRFGRYPDMMRTMLGGHGLSPATLDIDAVGGDTVPAPEDGDALLITGSPAGVYEAHEWVPPLEEAIRAWARAGLPVVGICFGHQIMAKALGGHVALSERGWGVGVHTYELLGPRPVPGLPPRLACAVSHKDQVVNLPPGALRVGGSAFCPNGIIRYAEGRCLSFQMHPEFDHAFAVSLMAARRDSIPPAVFDHGMASLENETDRGLLARWIAGFFTGDIS